MNTPAREQYLRIKAAHKNEILLFRMGDFFETFDDDAIVISRELQIALTSREFGKGNRVPLAGIPCHSLDPHLSKLIKRGFKVAICEQVSKNGESSGEIIDRKVVRVVTPGTVVEDSIIDQKSNNYLASITLEKDTCGIAYTDITTGEFLTTQIDRAHMESEINRISPSEILVTSTDETNLKHLDSELSTIEEYDFDRKKCSESLLTHFQVSSMESFGCNDLPLSLKASGAIIHYLSRQAPELLSQIKTLRTYNIQNYMSLDKQTMRNLELFEGGRWQSTDTSLLSVLDHSKTSMGSRLLRRWIGQPLLNVKSLTNRQNSVEWFHTNSLRRENIILLLKSVSDIERVANKLLSLNATPRDLSSLSQSLGIIPKLREMFFNSDDKKLILEICENLKTHDFTIQQINSAIVEDPQIIVGEGGVIKNGYSTELDNLRQSSDKSQNYIVSLQASERSKTGIKTLKVGYNKVFGYYIEVTKAQSSLVPENYIRRQTLTNAERYITTEIKEYESKILSAKDKIKELELSLYKDLCEKISKDVPNILQTAQILAKVDVYASFAEAATQFNYIRPTLNNNSLIDIQSGRHPVVEKMVGSSKFVPNDIELSNEDTQLMILTGPNMAGKSTYIRQVGIIVLMAQIGSFVPASSATIGLVDRIFTRIGMQDDISVGHSTFMIEMVETASIIYNATPKSLIILDEIGRGTSTYDGLAIAKSIAEFIHNQDSLGCKTLFATHYHELTELEDYLPRVKNYNVAVSERNGTVTFLRKIETGGADQSFGIHVAKLAGLPEKIINRSHEILLDLETSEITKSEKNPNSSIQIPLFNYPQPQLDPQPQLQKLLELNIESMTPIEAITKLFELQQETLQHHEIKDSLNERRI